MIKANSFKVVAILFGMMVSAATYADTCYLKVAITENGQPLMRSVESTILENDKKIATSTNHSYTKELVCNKTYAIEVNGKLRRKNIFLKTDSTVVIVIN